MRARRRIYAHVMLALGGFLLAVLMPFLDFIELRFFDARMRFRGSQPAPDDVVLILIDDFSMHHIKKRWPWPRSYLATAVDFLREAGAQVIGIDISLSDEDYDPSDDVSLAEALERAGSVILPVKIGRRVEQTYEYVYLEEPLAIFQRENIESGYINLIVDPDGHIRRVRLREQHDGQTFYPFSAAVAREYQEISGVNPSIIDTYARDDYLMIDYVGPPGSIESYSFYEIYESRIAPQEFEGKIVLIGAAFPESHDLYMTSFYRHGMMYGVEIHANVLHTLLSGTSITYVPMFTDLSLLLLLSFFAVGTGVWTKPAIGMPIFLSIVAFVVFISFVLFATNMVLLRISKLTFVSLVGFISSTVYRFVGEERQKRSITQYFSRYVSPAFVNELVQNEDKIELGGEEAEVAIMFVDLRGYTTLSEELPATAVVEFLNGYFEVLTNAVHEHRGMVNKFIGDAILAVFGAPLRLENNALAAVKACLTIREKVAEMNVERMESNQQPIRVGMAVHCGKVVIGNIGSKTQMDYTVIGDTVNTCSRIEALTKDLQVDLLISEKVAQDMSGEIEAVDAGAYSLKGKKEQINVFSIP